MKILRVNLTDLEKYQFKIDLYERLIQLLTNLKGIEQTHLQMSN